MSKKITLYSEDFTTDSWMAYCRELGINEDVKEIELHINNIEIIK